MLLLAGYRVADDDSGAVEIEFARRPPGVHQRHPRTRHGPLVRVVHRLGHLRRNRQLPGQRAPVPIPYPTADRGVGLLGGLRVRVVVQRRVPPRRVNLADRVHTAGDVAPERLGVRGVREDRADANDGDGVLERVNHLVQLPVVRVRCPSRPHAPVDGGCHFCHVREQATLCAVNRFQPEPLLEVAERAAVGAGHPPHRLGRDA